AAPLKDPVAQHLVVDAVRGGQVPQGGRPAQGVQLPRDALPRGVRLGGEGGGGALLAVAQISGAPRRALGNLDGRAFAVSSTERTRRRGPLSRLRRQLPRTRGSFRGIG